MYLYDIHRKPSGGGIESYFCASARWAGEEVKYAVIKNNAAPEAPQ
ncbi:hypothetical protein [Leclercia sp.]|nr:hypothetical protein [Leclercia sp.]